MSAGQPSPGRRGDRLAGGLALLILIWTVLLHQGLGPAPPDRDAGWLYPGAFLLPFLASDALTSLGGRVPAALLIFVTPALALTLAIFASTRRVGIRLLAVVATVSCAVIVFYGVQAPRVWGFFQWRWSAVMLTFSLVTGTALLAPWLTAQWRRSGPAMRGLLYLPVFLALVTLERDVTGTDPALRFSISPWPALQVTALQIAVPLLVTGMLGVALGLAVRSSLRGPASLILGAAAASFSATFIVLVAARLGSLPLDPERGLLTPIGIAALVVFVAAAVMAPHDRPALRARVWALAGLLCALPLVVGTTLAWLDYRVTREGHAPEVITALEVYHDANGYFPDDLDELREAGLLTRVPRPRIWVPSVLDRHFRFQNFGSSYILEFDAPRWVQCAYNPPFAEYPDDDEEVEDAATPAETVPPDRDVLAAAWSCPATPPELW